MNRKELCKQIEEKYKNQFTIEHGYHCSLNRNTTLLIECIVNGVMDQVERINKPSTKWKLCSTPYLKSTIDKTRSSENEKGHTVILQTKKSN